MKRINCSAKLHLLCVICVFVSLVVSNLSGRSADCRKHFWYGWHILP